MQQESSNQADNESIKDENEFLKLKMMLERNANFGSCESEELPAEIENMFLKNVMAFEEQWENCTKIKIFDKIQRPDDFRPVGEVPLEEMEKEWNRLKNCLAENDIVLDACNPDVSKYELYRFVTEELFDYEMDNICLPGWTTNFIYEEFHPDPSSDNEAEDNTD